MELRGKGRGSGTTHPKNHGGSHSLYIYGQRSPGLMGFVVYFFLQAQGLWSGLASPSSLGKKGCCLYPDFSAFLCYFSRCLIRSQSACISPSQDLGAGHLK